MMKIGFIGGGNMSTAIFKGILANDDKLAADIWVSGPNLKNLEHWSELGAQITDKNGKLLSVCDIIFLGVKPGMLNTAIEDCLNTCSSNLVADKNITFVSMLTGINMEQLHKALKILPVKYRVIRILPNTPMAVGAGSCMYTPDVNISQEQCNMLEKLLHGCGVCEKIPESLMDSLGVLTGCGPAFIYIIIEALSDGAVKQGCPRALALRHAAQMVMGSAKMVLKSGKHPGLLKDEVCSPGGTTICGVTALENGRLRATLISAIEAATMRTKDIGKK